MRYKNWNTSVREFVEIELWLLHEVERSRNDLGIWEERKIVRP